MFIIKVINICLSHFIIIKINVFINIFNSLAIFDTVLKILIKFYEEITFKEVIRKTYRQMGKLFEI